MIGIYLVPDLNSSYLSISYMKHILCRGSRTEPPPDIYFLILTSSGIVAAVGAEAAVSAADGAVVAEAVVAVEAAMAAAAAE